METKSNFKSFRESRPDLTLDGVADLLGVDRTTVLRWEKGFTPIPTKRLQDIERITGIPRQELRPDLYAGMVADSTQPREQAQ